MMSAAEKSDEPLVIDFKIGVDRREQRPWTFEGIRGDAQENHRPLIIPCEPITLESCDYCPIIDGVPHKNCGVERKAWEDLLSTLTHGRPRFTNELERCKPLTFSAVVCEVTLEQIAKYAPVHSNVNPKTIVRSIIAFSMRYPTKWFCLDGRRNAELFAFQLLRRYVVDFRKSQKESAA